MIVVVAKDYLEYREWLDQNFKYVGDRFELAEIDPKEVEKIEFVGNFRDHPIYFSDDLLQFQMDVALAKQGFKTRIVKKDGGILASLKSWFT